ncbi:MAG: mannonate dehydratase [Verrucomicrobiales bacterium]|nr:mannonate dehydratase [Verrucomicrobiales bacterium]
MDTALLVTPFSDENLQLAAQVGTTDVVSIFPGLELDSLLKIRNKVKSFGLKLSVIERYVPTLDFIHGTGQRDQQIEDFKTLIRNLGEAEVPVLCYSWMPDDDWQRTSLEARERGGALVTEFDMRDPDTVQSVTGFDFQSGNPTSAATLWDNLEYFLNEVIPVAEDAGVKLAMHPDDPPIAMLRGQERILSTPEAFERLVSIVDSPSNGICFCQGSFASHANEYDIPSLIKRLAPYITFAHFRDVVGAVPHFTEAFHDTGKTDMAASMKAYLDSGVDCPIRPDHVPTLVGERNEFPGYHMLGRLWAVGYMRGIIDTLKTVEG